MTSNNPIEREYKAGSDAADSKSGVRPDATGLHKDVADFLSQHRTVHERLSLTAAMRNEGPSGEQTSKLEKMGFPSLTLCDSGQGLIAPEMQSTEQKAHVAKESNSVPDAVLNGVGNVTDRAGGYTDFSNGAIHLDQKQQNLLDQLRDAEQTNSGANMEAAYKAIKEYRDSNPGSDSLYRLGEAFNRKGLLPKLAVCALEHEFPDLQNKGEISRQQVINEARNGDVMHQMFADNISKDFASYNYHDNSSDVRHAGKGHVHNGHIDIHHVKNLIYGGWNKGGPGASESGYNPKDE